MTEKNILSISLDNANSIKNVLNLDGLNETTLRIIHSILDQQRQNIIDKLNEIEDKNVNDDDVNNFLDTLNIK
jgi:hypothetical protein